MVLLELFESERKNFAWKIIPHLKPCCHCNDFAFFPLLSKSEHLTSAKCNPHNISYQINDFIS